MQAARIGEINCMSVLLNAGSDPNCKMFPSLQTPLMAACFAGHKDVAELLVSHGASWTEKDMLVIFLIIHYLLYKCIFLL